MRVCLQTCPPGPPGPPAPQVMQMKRRYEVGLDKLFTAEKEVNIMKQELIELQPKLIETGKEVEETLQVNTPVLIMASWQQ